MNNERMEKIQEKDTNEYINKLLLYLRQIINCEIQLLDVEKTKQKYLEAIENLNKSDSASIQNKDCPEKPILEEVKYFDFEMLVLTGISSAIGLGVAWLAGAFTPASSILSYLIWGGATSIMPILNHLAFIKTKEQLLDSYNKEMIKYNNELNEYEESIDERTKKVIREKKEKLDYEYKIEKLDELSAEVKNTLSILYGKNVVHKKYQKFEAILSIYEYISTKRTKSLEFLNNDKGAYNLYEEEVLTGKDAKFEEKFVDIEASDCQQQFYYDTSSNKYLVLLSLANKLANIRNRQEINDLLQTEIEKQEELQTVVLNEKPPIKK